MKCPADRVRLEDCSTRLVRKRQNCGLRRLSSYVELYGQVTGQEIEKRWHLMNDQKTSIEGAEVMCFGKLLQKLQPERLGCRVPTVVSHRVVADV